jgi:hypothetical protein
MGDDALKAARKLAIGLDPLAASVRCGTQFEAADAGSGGLISLRFFGDDVAIRFPELEVQPDSPLPPHIQALLVYHLAISDGALPTGDWRAFADLPDGRFYAQAFQGYTGDALVRRLGGQSDKLANAIASVGGRALAREELATNADCAWVVPALPRVPVAIVWWHSDDEFAARAELLFDSTASHHLPIDGCAVLGSWLTSLLAAEAERQGI